MVVGEVSGDALGASLIQALEKKLPDTQIIVEGIVGNQLLAAGAKCLFPMEKINLMGLFQPLLHLPELFKIRRTLVKHFTENRPDVFIGIDAPDFNLGLECLLRKQGIKTVHYVSPTIWAWRKGRIKAIKKAVDLMLTLFPFETKIYEQAKIPACFVGHPFADEIPLENNKEAAKKALGFSEKDTVIAILPGSRNKELEYLAELYLQTAEWCLKAWQKKQNQNKERLGREKGSQGSDGSHGAKNSQALQFILPVVSLQHKNYIEHLISKFSNTMTQTHLSSENSTFTASIHVMVGNASLAMAACDTALVTSGTATLEVMLHKKPMVVAYKMNPITFQIAKHLVKLPHIAMANIVAEETLVPEFIQDKVIPEKMGAVLLKWLEDSQDKERIIKRYTEIHQEMRRNSSEKAAEAICSLSS